MVLERTRVDAVQLELVVDVSLLDRRVGGTVDCHGGLGDYAVCDVGRWEMGIVAEREWVSLMVGVS